MSRVERLALWAALLLALGAFLGSGPIRAAFAERSSDDDAPFAVCAIWDLTDELARSPRFAESREERLIALRSRGHEAALAEYERLRRELDAIDRESASEEEMARGQELWQQTNDAWEKLEEFQGAFEEHRTSMYLADYRAALSQVLESAEAIAEDMGFSCVVSTTLPIDDQKKQPEDVWDLWEIVKFQAAAVYPDDADITADVRDDLKLE